MSSPENAIQLILPSSASEMSLRIKETAQRSGELLLRGEIMGGEPWHKVLYELAQNEVKIYATESAAMSLRYDLSLVKRKGINIVSEEVIAERIRNNPEAEIQTSDVNWSRLKQLFASMKVSLAEIDAILVCVQDHGLPPNPDVSVKAFRTKMHAEFLRKTQTLSALLFDSRSVPSEFPRLTSNLQAIQQRFGQVPFSFVMDSSLAVLSGVFLDPAVSAEDWNLVVNFGNGHTVLGMFSPEGKISGIFETHTHLVARSPEQFRSQLVDFLEEKLRNEKILEAGGHGCVYFENFESPDKTWVIGPRRSLAKELDLDFSFAHPIGNMMMSGPLGMIRLAFPGLLESA